jgi:hypothetical protein|tara:strand:- start:327 stop:581 length:255 start_codon:yes stop_codon:yes gene_type:complete
MSGESWYTGEFAIARGFITLILAIIVLWFLIQCYIEIKTQCQMLHKYCCYKTATVVPIPEARITIDPVNAYAKDILLKNITIIL